MRKSRIAAVVGSLLLAGLLPSAEAQTDQCLVGAPVVTALLSVTIPKIAFTSVVKTSFEQRLYDGNTIRSVTRSREARDSSGRTRTEFHTGCVRGDDGQMHSILSVSVSDPAAGTSSNWQEGSVVRSKVAQVFHRPKLALQSTRLLTPELQDQQKKMAGRLQGSQATAESGRPNVAREDLGTRQINGFAAKGMRVTETIPAGAAGNDLPILVVNETWTAVNTPGLTLLRISEDPRRGRTVTEFEELKLEEPDASLFAPPADYVVKELTLGAPREVSLGAVAP